MLPAFPRVRSRVRIDQLPDSGFITATCVRPSTIAWKRKQMSVGRQPRIHGHLGTAEHDASPRGRRGCAQQQIRGCQMAMAAIAMAPAEIRRPHLRDREGGASAVWGPLDERRLQRERQVAGGLKAAFGILVEALLDDPLQSRRRSIRAAPADLL